MRPPGHGTTPLVLAEGVVRHYVSEAEVVAAVDGVDLAASAGEFICLHGQSGSGKTTLLNLLAGLDLPTSGHLVVDGTVLPDLPEKERVRLRREVVGMVHQHDYLIEELDAIENVSLPLEARGIPVADAGAEASALLARVGLGVHGRRFPRQLSGGQRQRVGIARALSGGRRIILADEPTGALDSRNAATIFELLRALSDEGTLVIVASHDPACLEHATRHLELRDGRVVTSEVLC